MVEDDLAVHVLNQDPERLRGSVDLSVKKFKIEKTETRQGVPQCIVGTCADLVVPLEVGRDGELYFERGAGDGLQVDGQVQFGELVHVLVDGLPHFWHPNELT